MRVFILFSRGEVRRRWQYRGTVAAASREEALHASMMRLYGRLVVVTHRRRWGGRKGATAYVLQVWGQDNVARTHTIALVLNTRTKTAL